MKLAYYFFVHLFFTSHLFAMELWNKVLPVEIFSNITHHCFKTPTHIEEIVAQDKRLLMYRLVCRKWEQFFNTFLYTWLDRVDFKSMEFLFVQNRHWDNVFFKRRYEERINYLKKVTIIKNSQPFLNWISNQEKEISDYQLTEQEKNTSNNHSIFDWAVISKLANEQPWAPDIRDNERELSFYVFHSYFAHGGFLCRELLEKLLWFLLNNLDGCIKHGQKLPPYHHTWECVFRYIYFEDEKFNKHLLNMNFSYFLGAFFHKMHQYGPENCVTFTLYCKADYLLKQVFQDFKNLPFEVNYQEFIEYLYLGSFKCQKHFTEIFFNKFRHYFSRNNFEGRFFLRYLLLYRLKFHQDDDYDRPGFLISISNINRLILDFIREFNDELKNCSSSQKEEYCKLFKSNEELNISRNIYCKYYTWFQKTLKKEKTIEGFLINLQEMLLVNNNLETTDQNIIIKPAENIESVVLNAISSEKQNNPRQRCIITRKIILGISLFICGLVSSVIIIKALYHKLFLIK